MSATLEFLNALSAAGLMAVLNTLWQALAVVAATDERLRGTDFLRLATRAATQESQVEQQRLQAARLVFDPAA